MVLQDEDEELSEALQRDAELNANPALGISLEQLDEQISQHRSKSFLVMEDVIAFIVQNGPKEKRAFLTWGRVFDGIEEEALINILEKGLKTFGIDRSAKISICRNLGEVSSAEYFHEGLLKFAWKPIPFGVRTYPAWAQKMRSAIKKGKEIYSIGIIKRK